MRTNRWKIAFAVAFYILTGTTPTPAVEKKKLSTYVWLFTPSATDAQSLADMVTEEFEESLFKSGCLIVLERRQLPRLLAHQEQEKKITNASALDSASRKELAIVSADSVVFGKITDDVEGGQLKIAVTLQTLAGETLVDLSVRIPRGKRFDSEERELRIGELASSLCNSLRDSKIGPPPTPPPAATDRKTSNGFEFTLEGCAPEGSDLQCWFKVTNKRERRTLGVWPDYSRLLDQKGNSHKPNRALGSDGGHEFIVLKLQLKTDVTERFGLLFGGLGDYVTSLNLLVVHANDFDLTWKNVKVE